MQRQPIKSSIIAEVGYNVAHQTMEVLLSNGRTYRHWPITPSEFEQFMKAESKGAVYHSITRGKDKSHVEALDHGPAASVKE